MAADQINLLAHVTTGDGDHQSISLFVPGMSCGGCMQKIETALDAIPQVLTARTNLSAKRVTVTWRGETRLASSLIDGLAGIGFDAMPYAVDTVDTADAEKDRELLRALAVAGFGAANIMLLSVAVWSGFGGSMAHETRQLFHWVSALIAVPVVMYSGRVFFRSAWSAVKLGQMNMDVPISLAIMLATIASLVQLAIGGEHVYFDASATLLFFLLIGRYLDQSMRRRAGSAVKDLLALRADKAIRLTADGTAETVSPDALAPGDRVFVPAGFTVSADGTVVDGASEIDTSLMTGESVPESVARGTRVFAGTTNLSSALTIEVSAGSGDSMLAEITRLMETAEQGKGSYRKISDRVAQFYAPAVHIIAAATVLVWLSVGAGWNQALMTGIAVLIITCPCAVALAIPVVNIVAVGRLFRSGILCKSEDALERLSKISTVIFDKTGTLTEGRLALSNAKPCGDTDLSMAASLAQSSAHPLSRALVQGATENGLTLQAVEVTEVPGCGVEAQLESENVRLGNAEWVGLEGAPAESKACVYFRQGDRDPVRFDFDETLRPLAVETCDALRAQGVSLSMLSGDREAPARAIAAELDVADWQAHLSPLDKSEFVRQQTEKGERPLYVGDGVNDAPAAQAAFVSMSPAEGAKISQNAADFVLQKSNLSAIPETLQVAKLTQTLVKQNLALAFMYNAIAIPASVLGFATPLVAAIAMSSSSLLVTLNGLRLHERAPRFLRS